jgi:hypothetical protein
MLSSTIIFVFAAICLAALVVWIWMSWVVASRAKSANKSFAGFLVLGLIFSPLISWLTHMLTKPNGNSGARGEASTMSNLEKCPHCAEMIQIEARICRFCKSNVEGEFSALLQARAKAFESQNLAVSNSARERQLHAESVKAKRSETLSARMQAVSAYRQSKRFKVVVVICVSAIGLLVIGSMAFNAYNVNAKNQLAKDLLKKVKIQAAADEKEFSKDASTWEQVIVNCIQTNDTNIPWSWHPHKPHVLELGSRDMKTQMVVDCVWGSLTGTKKSVIEDVVEITWHPGWRKEFDIWSNSLFTQTYKKALNACEVSRAFVIAGVEHSLNVSYDLWPGTPSVQKMRCLANELFGPTYASQWPEGAVNLDLFGNLQGASWQMHVSNVEVIVRPR